MRNRLQAEHLYLYLLFKVLAVVRFGFCLCKRKSQDSLGFSTGLTTPPGSASVIEPLNTRGKKKKKKVINETRILEIPVFHPSFSSETLQLTPLGCRSLVSSANPVSSSRAFSKLERLVIFWQKLNMSFCSPNLTHKAIQFIKI